MRTVPFLSLVVGALLLLPGAVGLPCNGEITEIKVDGQTVYIDDRSALGEPRPYIYLETNGVVGLQSGYEGVPYCDETGPPCSDVNLVAYLVYGDPCFHSDWPDIRLA